MPVFSYLAEVHLAVSGLSSGYSREVHGQVRPRHAAYRVTRKGARLVPSGSN